MLKSKSLLALLLLMTAAAFAAPASSDGTKTSAAPIKTILRSDLSLKSTLVVPDPAQPAAGATTAAFLRTCRCSCGQPCKTDADCGGGICSAGITCCNRTPGPANASAGALDTIFQQEESRSSRKNPGLSAVTVNCKQ